ncbi:MAG: conjugal transfer protein TraF [bacterium]|nr:MAG: conjugal transfer protein TraF [bacterium]
MRQLIINYCFVFNMKLAKQFKRPLAVVRKQCIVSLHSSWLMLLLVVNIYGCIIIPTRVRANGNVSSARAIGMGGAFTALARGVEAARWNPANLGLKENPKISISLLSAGLSFGNSSFSSRDYNLYSGAFLEQSDIETILDKIPNHGLRIDASGELRVLSFSFRRVAVVFAGEALACGLIAKDYLDLVFNGNELRRKYSFTGTEAVSHVLSNTMISVGFPIQLSYFKEFAIGASLKYFRGFIFTSLEHVGGSFITRTNGIDADGQVIMQFAKGGSGWGTDIGIVAVSEPGVTIAIAVNNIMASSYWSKGAKEEEAFYFGRSVTVENAEEDTLFDYDSRTIKISTIRYYNPKVFRLGVAYEMPHWTVTADVSVEWRQYDILTPFPRLSIGTEYKRLKWLLLRGGLAFGGASKFATSIGFGIRKKKIIFDFGFINHHAMLLSLAKGTTIALAFGLVF